MDKKTNIDFVNSKNPYQTKLDLFMKTLPTLPTDLKKWWLYEIDEPTFWDGVRPNISKLPEHFKLYDSFMIPVTEHWISQPWLENFPGSKCVRLINSYRFILENSKRKSDYRISPKELKKNLNLKNFLLENTIPKHEAFEFDIESILDPENFYKNIKNCFEYLGFDDYSDCKPFIKIYRDAYVDLHSFLC